MSESKTTGIGIHELEKLMENGTPQTTIQTVAYSQLVQGLNELKEKKTLQEISLVAMLTANLALENSERINKLAGIGQ